jgi:hypothetical protein
MIIKTFRTIEPIGADKLKLQLFTMWTVMVGKRSYRYFRDIDGDHGAAYLILFLGVP